MMSVCYVAVCKDQTRCAYSVINMARCVAHGDNKELYRGMHMLADGGMQVACTNSIPDNQFEAIEAEVALLKPRKRKNWKGRIRNTSGENVLVRYNEQGVVVPGTNFVSHFESKVSHQKQSMMGSAATEWRIVKPFGVTPDIKDNMVTVRRGRDVALDSLAPDMQFAALAAQIEENRTYNHTAYRHRVSVPTRSGEPVRG